MRGAGGHMVGFDTWRKICEIFSSFSENPVVSGEIEEISSLNLVISFDFP
jgi:hypothetical protein